MSVRDACEIISDWIKCESLNVHIYMSCGNEVVWVNIHRKETDKTENKWNVWNEHGAECKRMKRAYVPITFNHENTQRHKKPVKLKNFNRLKNEEKKEYEHDTQKSVT